jgi:hypothetical protein
MPAVERVCLLSPSKTRRPEGRRCRLKARSTDPTYGAPTDLPTDRHTYGPYLSAQSRNVLFPKHNESSLFYSYLEGKPS